MYMDTPDFKLFPLYYLVLHVSVEWFPLAVTLADYLLTLNPAEGNLQ